MHFDDRAYLRCRKTTATINEKALGTPLDRVVEEDEYDLRYEREIPSLVHVPLFEGDLHDTELFVKESCFRVFITRN